MKNYLLSLSAIILVGCTTMLTDQAQTIKIISLQQKEDLGCDSLGLVYGGSGVGWDSAGDLRNANNEMLNNAALKGANAINIMDSVSNPFMSTVSGMALRCNFK